MTAQSMKWQSLLSKTITAWFFRVRTGFLPFLGLLCLSLLLPPGFARAEGFSNETYTFYSEASQGGKYPAGYWTFTYDTVYDQYNTDDRALYVTNEFAPTIAHWYPRIAEELGEYSGLSQTATPNRNVTFRIDDTLPSGTAARTLNVGVTLGSAWWQEFSGTILMKPNASIGAIIHECAHSLQLWANKS